MNCVKPRMAHKIKTIDNIKQLNITAEVMEVPCERCGITTEVQLEPSRTYYVDESKNVEIWLCRECADEYHQHWDDMWAEYHSGLL